MKDVVMSMSKERDYTPNGIKKRFGMQNEKFYKELNK